jgi:hypothetical protein
VDFTDQANPDLRLLEGSLTWEVWSKNGSNPGNLGVLTTEDSENYTVKIANGTNPGAADFKGGLLDPAGDNYSSIVAGSVIAGNLTGDLEVVATSGGSGGAVELTIDGDAIGNITVPKVTSLTIGGDLFGDISISAELEMDLIVSGNVESSATIEIGIVTGNVSFNTVVVGDGVFAGDLIVHGDLPGLTIFGVTTSTASIDLDGHDVAGNLILESGGAATILNGGTVLSDVAVLLADDGIPGADFSGSATFEHVVGRIQTESAHGSDISGTITINGDVDGLVGAQGGNLSPAGTIYVGGDLNGSIEIYGPSPNRGELEGTVEVAGNMIGEILVNGNIAGEITIHGTCTGVIRANSNQFEGGDITGQVTIDQVFDGNICADNMTPGDPDESFFTYGELGCDARVCDVAPARSAPGLDHDGGRYLLVTPSYGDCLVALRVITEDVDPPEVCSVLYVQSNGTLEDTPVCRTSAQWGTVAVGDEEILPVSDYAVEAIYYADGQCGTTIRWTSSESASENSGIWGDTNNSISEVDLDDILCVLDAFAGIFTAYCTPHSADIMGCQPNGKHDLDDILAVLDAFAGLTYGDTGCASFCNGGSQTEPGGEGPMGPQSVATVTLTADEEAIRPGHVVNVEVTVTSPETALRGYQVELAVSGGTAGSLVLEDISIDAQEADFLFYGLSYVSAFNESKGQMTAALSEGSAGASSAKHLATFTFRASNDAGGEFTIALGASATLLRDEVNQTVEWQPGDPVVVQVE